MDLKQIALFAWLPFLAADLGGLFGGYLSPFLMKHLRVPLICSRIAGVVARRVDDDRAGLHRARRVAVSGHRALLRRRLRAPDDLGARQHARPPTSSTRARSAPPAGFAGMAAWIGGLGFSLLVGALADSIGYTPLFGALGAFDLIGATLLVILMRGVDARPRA